MNKLYNSTALGFDGVAADYDAEERGNLVLARMRTENRKWFDRAFPEPARLLEIGSGTGLEAAYLADKLHKIALLDVSAKMLELAAARVEQINLSTLLGNHLFPAAQVGRLVEYYGAKSFDGAYSSFGPLNCEPELGEVAAGLARLIKPGGRLVFSVMPRFCLTEILWFGLHLDFKNATRRWKGKTLARALPGQPLMVQTYYYNPSKLIKLFKPYFRKVRLKAFPLIWPPPYLSHLPQRYPRFFNILGKADSWISDTLPILATFGDHFLIELERVAD